MIIWLTNTDQHDGLVRQWHIMMVNYYWWWLMTTWLNQYLPSQQLPPTTELLNPTSRDSWAPLLGQDAWSSRRSWKAWPEGKHGSYGDQASPFSRKLIDMKWAPQEMQTKCPSCGDLTRFPHNGSWRLILNRLRVIIKHLVEIPVPTMWSNLDSIGEFSSTCLGSTERTDSQVLDVVPVPVHGFHHCKGIRFTGRNDVETCAGCRTRMTGLVMIGDLSRMFGEGCYWLVMMSDWWKLVPQMTWPAQLVVGRLIVHQRVTDMDVWRNVVTSENDSSNSAATPAAKAAASPTTTNTTHNSCNEQQHPRRCMAEPS